MQRKTETNTFEYIALDGNVSKICAVLSANEWFFLDGEVIYEITINPRLNGRVTPHDINVNLNGAPQIVQTEL